jgi:hypothetical protein
MRRWVFALVALAPAPAFAAETVYVIDQIYVGLRAAPGEGHPVVKTLETGAALEVLERDERHMRVRDAQGTEGWIEARYVSGDPPARLQLTRLQEEFNRARQELVRTRAQLAEAQERLKKVEADLAREKERGETPPQPAVPAAPVPPPAVAPPPTSAGSSWFSPLWLVISFAMLGIGFALGIAWLRERHRKRLGGMYLRI